MKSGNSVTEYDPTQLEQLEFPYEILLYFRQKLDDFTISLFKRVLAENKEHRGLLKTRLKDYHALRKRYDSAFTMLEAQGFIEKREDGTRTPYYVTIRGEQLTTLLIEEYARQKTT
jgi:predicted transcriptional regulator